MSKQYWVGEFFVDLSRNQISQHYQSQTLPPKALLVLTHLAENRGKVISYDELLDAVWPNSVVTPNTLQRSIAQLRKALGEDSRAQGIIKTHSKQGYSLECDVSWSDQGRPGEVVNTDHALRDSLGENVGSHNEELPEVEGSQIDDGVNTPDEYNSSQSESRLSRGIKNSTKNYWILAAVIALVLLIVLPQDPQDNAQLHFNDLRYLTATDDKEYGGSYSPDGQFILFRRYYNPACINNIWAKNVTTFEEVVLTKERGTYGSHSLSADGSNLVFIKQEDCTKPVTQKTCYKLMSLDFKQALLHPQTPRELLHCQNSAIKKPVWLDGQHIAMMQKEEHNWRLIRFSVDTQSSTTLYEIEDGNIISFDYSVEREMLAVTSRKNDGAQYIEMLSADGEVKSSHKIRLPADVRRYLSVHANFFPHTDKLIFGDGSSLYTMTYDGDVHRQDFQLIDSAGGPTVSPDGRRILLINGRYDSDVARLSFSDSQQPHKNKAELSVFERSISHEDNANFQPGGSLVAFVSRRTGNEQVWLTGEGRTQVISQFPKGNFIRNLRWDPSGTSLLILANQELHQMFLHSDPIPFNFPYPIDYLFHWDNVKQLVIANIQVNGITEFVEIDLSSLEYKVINGKRVNWAVKSPQGPLIFIDHFGRFWQKGAVEDKLIEPLTGQGSSKRFLVENSRVYGINKQDQLWSYDLDSGEFEILADVPTEIDYMEDINDGEILVSVVVSAKKEVIEVSVTH